MASFSTRAFWFAALLGTGRLADAQTAQSGRATYPYAARSDAWMDSVRRLPLPAQLAAVRQHMLRDTAYRGFQPAMCRVVVAPAAGRPASAASGSADPAADTRPPGPTLFYVLDDYPAYNNTAAGVRDFWHRVAARRIGQVTLLPGAAATALYGSQAANGAVLLSSREQLGQP